MDTSSWKWFRYTDIFRISGSKTTPVADLETYGKGVFPYVTTQAVNNGVEGFYNYSTEKGCVLTVDSAVLGFCSYQENDFSASDHVEVLTPLFNMNRYIALFLVTLINKEQYRYNYGRKCSQIKLRKSRIKLPVTAEGTPDWQYMETFVKDQIIPQLPKKAQRVWLKKYDTKPLQDMKMKLNTDEWRWFVIKDIFEVKAGKYHYKDEYDAGNTPYLSATAVNNGVGEQINLPPEFEGGVVTTEKVKCTAFYQPKPFCATSDVNIIKRKDGKPINQYVGLFLSSIINFNESFRWTYGRQCRVNDTENIRIKLPVTPEGEPDWQFMEDYIKSLPYSRNLEPSKPDEIVDELVEMKKEMIKMRRAMEAHQPGAINNYGTLNIYEK